MPYLTRHGFRIALLPCSCCSWPHGDQSVLGHCLQSCFGISVFLRPTPRLAGLDDGACVTPSSRRKNFYKIRMASPTEAAFATSSPMAREERLQQPARPPLIVYVALPGDLRQPRGAQFVQRTRRGLCVWGKSEISKQEQLCLRQATGEVLAMAGLVVQEIAQSAPC